MGLLNWLPGRKRRGELELMIRELVESARGESTFHDFDIAQVALWTALCDGAGDIAWQLVVKKTDKRMDWGLKRKRRRIDEARLLTMYWWMLLYHIVLLRHRGLGGRRAQDDLPALESAAHQFLERHIKKLSLPIEPGPWEHRWNRQFTLEAAMGIYNGVHVMLGLFNDLTKRIDRVSNFTTATEESFDERIRSLRD